jgi:uncharacterized protein with GYD domain
MATYILLLSMTQQGAEHIKDSPDRLERFKQRCRDLGVDFQAFYMTMGQYDGVFIVDAPSDESIAKLALGACSRGNTRTETLRAFTEEEYRTILAGLP